LPCGAGLDAVLCWGKLLLATGGRSISSQLAGADGLLREQLLLCIPLHRLG
ncbi:hypothetical protein M9458_030542, partial [Cirrhinus mrigala]